MIYYLNGKITVKEDDFIVMDVGGVGYKIFMHPQSIEETDVKKRTIIYCHTQKTDNDIRLYGFIEKENLELFEALTKISGIGPKTALRVASCLSVEELKEGIEKEDKQVMKKIFSIGSKKGQQVVFEMSRKFVKENKEDSVFKALNGLGFCREEIAGVLEKVSEKGSDEERTKEALKILGQKGK